jgi:hypothetical protein
VFGSAAGLAEVVAGVALHSRPFCGRRLDPFQPGKPGERLLPPVKGQKAAGRNMQGAGDVEDVHRPAPGLWSKPAEAVEFPDQLDAVDLEEKIEPSPLPRLIMAKLVLCLFLRPFVPKLAAEE